MFVVAVGVACLALGAALVALARSRQHVRSTLVVGASVFFPAIVFADALRFIGMHPAVVMVAAEVVTIGLLVTMAALYRSWVELLCQTWLTAGCITLIGLFFVALAARVPDTPRTNVDIIGVSLALFVAITVQRGIRGRLDSHLTRVAIMCLVWLRVVAWLAVAVTGALIGDRLTLPNGLLFVAYAFGGLVIARELVRPTRVTRRPPHPTSALVPAVLVGIALAFVVVAYTLIPGFARWSVVVLITGSVAAVLCLQVLTTRRLESASRSAAAQEEYFRTLVQDATDVIAICDRRGRLEYVSPAVDHVLGMSDTAEYIGTGAADLLGVDREVFSAALDETSLNGRALIDGRRGDQVLEASVSRRDDSFVLAVRDVTERDAMRASLHELAYNDGLTGLANRHRLVQDLDALLREQDSPVQALFVDLDGFKHVNDASGHRIGDAVLVQVASRLREVVDPGCLLARLGGDEFAVVLRGDAARAEVLAHRIHRSLVQHFAVDDHVYQLGASIGIAAAAPGLDAAGLLQRADLAMDEAKHSHRPWRYYEPEMSVHVREQAARDHELAQEWGRPSVQMYLQPIVTTQGLHVHSAEALLRWRRSTGEVTPPAAALAFAERTGRLATLTGWMVERVLAELAATPDLSTPIAVNMPPSLLTEPDFAAGLASRVAALGIPPSRLNLEITEDAVVEHGDAGIRALRALHDEGFRLHIDDFGTGFSSLSYLVRLPVDGLKIDRSFTRVVLTSKPARSVVLGLVSLSREIGCDLVAEGVETPAEHEALIDLGVPLAQGFWYARPASASLIGDRSHLSSWPTSAEAGLTRPGASSGMIGA